MLIEPRFKDRSRVERYATQLAEKHPDAIILSAGIGRTVYALERAALRAGLRVAAFRTQRRFAPHREIDWRVWDDDANDWDPPRSTGVPLVDVLVHELRPDRPDDIDSLHASIARSAGSCRGEELAAMLAVTLAAREADNVVAFTDDPSWPKVDGVTRHGT